jgi:hypothetical protein
VSGNPLHAQSACVAEIASCDSAHHKWPRDEWIEIPVPPIVTEETFTPAVERLQANKDHAPRRTITPSAKPKGQLQGWMRTEKSRLRRSLVSLQELMRQIRHHAIGDQVGELNAALRGHYGYYGVAGNIRALFKVYRAVERCWRKMLCSRSWACGPNCASLTGSCKRSQYCEPTAEERGALCGVGIYVASSSADSLHRRERHVERQITNRLRRAQEGH